MTINFRTDFLVDFGESSKVMVAATFAEDVDGLYMTNFRVYLTQSGHETDITRHLDPYARTVLEEEAIDRYQADGNPGHGRIGACC